MAYDILIRGGLVFDGASRPGEPADVAIADGRIAAIGPALVGGAARVIDAEGLAVAPGFIDIKTHSDFTLPINPKAESKLRQGVANSPKPTSEICWNQSAGWSRFCRPSFTPTILIHLAR